MLTKERCEEMLNAINDDSMYDWVAQNYYDLSSWEKRDIMLEYVYAVHRIHEDPYIDCDIVIDEICESLKESLMDEDEE